MKLVSIDPLGAVYAQILKGPKTREQIRSATKLSFDQVGDALVTLVWECKTVKIKGRHFISADLEATVIAA